MPKGDSRPSTANRICWCGTVGSGGFSVKPKSCIEPQGSASGIGVNKIPPQANAAANTPIKTNANPQRRAKMISVNANVPANVTHNMSCVSDSEVSSNPIKTYRAKRPWFSLAVKTANNAAAANGNPSEEVDVEEEIFDDRRPQPHFVADRITFRACALRNSVERRQRIGT